jgi:hypothetical protein
MLPAMANDAQYPLKLPDEFTLNQANLQAYAECARRFWLGYVERLPWPAVETTPVQAHEELMRLGVHFHRVVQRAESGIDLEQLAAGLVYPLDEWFAAYRDFAFSDLPRTYRDVEKTLSIPLYLEDAPSLPGLGNPAAQSRQLRLVAKYDLIACEPGTRAVIVDWKTTRTRTNESIMRQRLQSIIYPYVLVAASTHLPWGPIAPEQVEMRYWFTAAPSQPVILHYDLQQHQANHERLIAMVRSILSGREPSDFPKVDDTLNNRLRFCSFCVYRSRCDRGVTAGNVEDVIDFEGPLPTTLSTSLEFTLDDVIELSY